MGKKRKARRAAAAALDAAIRGDAAPAALVEPPPQRGTLEFYRDDEGRWRWRFIAENHRILADSGQGYSTYRGAVKGWTAMRLAENHRTVVPE
jgi:uncharacterized protein YegP (UPF0339 family)